MDELVSKAGGMATKHVLIVTPAFPPFPGGGERYARSLALALAQKGLRITVVTTVAEREVELWQGRGEEVVEEWDEGLRVIRCPLDGLRGGWTGLLAWRKLMVLVSMLPGDQTAVLLKMSRFIPHIKQLATILQKIEDVDLVHGFNVSWEYPIGAGWRLAKARGIPFVLTPFTHLGTGHDRVARNSTMDHQLHIFKDADQVLTLTAVERDGLLDYGLDAERVTVIGGGVDGMPDRDNKPAPLVSEPYILFLGRNSFEKGAIQAAEAILQLGEETRLVLAGQTAPEFERFYGRLSPNQKAQITPMGIVTEAEKSSLLHHAEMLLLPSRTDSFGIVLLEAWSHGKAVIGARAGGIPGVIDEGENGLLVEFGDVAGLATAVSCLQQNPQLKAQLAQNGYAKVQREYQWSRVAERVLKSYDQSWL